ncbi:MAG: TetR/AcrR family transcriptional regulator [Gemmatimonadales bacterium]
MAHPSSVRERILDSAADLFYKRGIRNVGIDEIIARAGVAKMSLYKHFPSKDALIVEWLRRRDQRWRHWFVTAVERSGSTPRRRILGVFDALAEWFGTRDFRGCAFINSAVELADPRHPGFQASLEHKELVYQYLRELTTAAGAPRPEALARQLVLLMDGAIVGALMQGSGAAPARDAKRAAQAMLAGASAFGEVPSARRSGSRPRSPRRARSDDSRSARGIRTQAD